MPNRLMIDPSSGEKFNIPLEMVEQAKKDGLVSAQEMVGPGGESYNIPEGMEKKAGAAGLGFYNLSPVPQPSTPEEIEAHERARAERSEISLENAPNLLADMWQKINQGGPADWRNTLNSIGPIAASFNRPLEAVRWSNVPSVNKARSLAAFKAPIPQEAVGLLERIQQAYRGSAAAGQGPFQVRHLGSIPAYIPPMAKAASSALQGGKEAAVASAMLGQKAATIAGNHPMKTAIGATALNHFMGDPLRLKQLVRSWFQQ